MKKSSPVDTLCAHPFAALMLLCLFIHAFYDTGSKYIIRPEGIVFIAFVSVFIFILFKPDITLFAKKSLVYITVALPVIAMLYLFLKIGKPAIFLYILEMTIIAAVAVVLKINNKLNASSIAVLIFLASFLLHVTYILYTPYYKRQHDSGSISDMQGHLGYIQYFLNNKFRLPDFDPRTMWQFYHPPLHHYIAALWVKVNTLLGMTYENAVESIQILTLFYSGCINIVSYKIFKLLNFKGSARLVPFAVVCFHPVFILLSGSINNDILSVLFMLLAVWFALRWYKSGRMADIAATALALGLGMMTKLSGALVAPAIAFIFIYKLYQTKGGYKGLFIQFVVFGLICVPLGTWHSLYNYFEYGMPFGYVPDLGENAYQYIGGYSAGERLFGFHISHFKKLYMSFADPYLEYNIFVSIFKSSIFGEYNMSVNAAALVSSVVLFYTNILICVFAFICKAIWLIKIKGDIAVKVFFIILYATLMGSFISFCFSYPYICTQDFRYITPTILTGAVALGFVLNRYNNILTTLIKVLAAVFVLGSTVLYIAYGFSI